MEDTLVSYDTALLAKKVGFDEECNSVYNKSLRKETLYYYEGNGTGVIKNSDVQNTSTGFVYLCTIPTQSLLQKWLREVHNIIVIPDLGWSEETNFTTFYCFQVYNIKNKKLIQAIIQSEIEYNTYEEALEQGLYEALKLINK